MNLLKRPSVDNIQQNDLCVNIENRWSSLEKEIIAAGICEGDANIFESLFILCNIVEFHINQN